MQGGNERRRHGGARHNSQRYCLQKGSSKLLSGEKPIEFICIDSDDTWREVDLTSCSEQRIQITEQLHLRAASFARFSFFWMFQWDISSCVLALLHLYHWIINSEGFQNTYSAENKVLSLQSVYTDIQTKFRIVTTQFIMPKRCSTRLLCILKWKPWKTDAATFLQMPESWLLAYLYAVLSYSGCGPIIPGYWDLYIIDL